MTLEKETETADPSFKYRIKMGSSDMLCTHNHGDAIRSISNGIFLYNLV